MSLIFDPKAINATTTIDNSLIAGKNGTLTSRVKQKKTGCFKFFRKFIHWFTHPKERIKNVTETFEKTLQECKLNEMAMTDKVNLLNTCHTFNERVVKRHNGSRWMTLFFWNKAPSIDCQALSTDIKNRLSQETTHLRSVKQQTSFDMESQLHAIKVQLDSLDLSTQLLYDTANGQVLLDSQRNALQTAHNELKASINQQLTKTLESVKNYLSDICKNDDQAIIRASTLKIYGNGYYPSLAELNKCAVTNMATITRLKTRVSALPTTKATKSLIKSMELTLQYKADYLQLLQFAQSINLESQEPPLDYFHEKVRALNEISEASQKDNFTFDNRLKDAISFLIEGQYHQVNKVFENLFSLASKDLKTLFGYKKTIDELLYELEKLHKKQKCYPQTEENVQKIVRACQKIKAEIDNYEIHLNLWAVRQKDAQQEMKELETHCEKADKFSRDMPSVDLPPSTWVDNIVREPVHPSYEPLAAYERQVNVINVFRWLCIGLQVKIDGNLTSEQEKMQLVLAIRQIDEFLATNHQVLPKSMQELYERVTSKARLALADLFTSYNSWESNASACKAKLNLLNDNQKLSLALFEGQEQLLNVCNSPFLSDSQEHLAFFKPIMTSIPKDLLPHAPFFEKCHQIFHASSPHQFEENELQLLETITDRTDIPYPMYLQLSFLYEMHQLRFHPNMLCPISKTAITDPALSMSTTPPTYYNRASLLAWKEIHATDPSDLLANAEIVVEGDIIKNVAIFLRMWRLFEDLITNAPKLKSGWVNAYLKACDPKLTIKAAYFLRSEKFPSKVLMAFLQYHSEHFTGMLDFLLHTERLLAPYEPLLPYDLSYPNKIVSLIEHLDILSLHLEKALENREEAHMKLDLLHQNRQLFHLLLNQPNAFNTDNIASTMDYLKKMLAETECLITDLLRMYVEGKGQEGGYKGFTDQPQTPAPKDFSPSNPLAILAFRIAAADQSNGLPLTKDYWQSFTSCFNSLQYNDLCTQQQQNLQHALQTHLNSFASFQSSRQYAAAQYNYVQNTSQIKEKVKAAVAQQARLFIAS